MKMARALTYGAVAGGLTLGILGFGASVASAEPPPPIPVPAFPVPEGLRDPAYLDQVFQARARAYLDLAFRARTDPDQTGPSSTRGARTVAGRGGRRLAAPPLSG